MTLILAWSFEEAGKILETYKIYENKPADKLMEKSESSPYLKVHNHNRFAFISMYIMLLLYYRYILFS